MDEAVVVCFLRKLASETSVASLGSVAPDVDVDEAVVVCFSPVLELAVFVFF